MKQDNINVNESQDELLPRPPIVVVLGHVDHGKTSLLDYIRNTKVAEKEAGGITQHIGAYEIEINNKKITFIDTPGHEAFTKIRTRGAKAADIALLVIAADEGIKPQTKESIECIKNAQLPFIVVFTKIDKESANTQKIKSDLAELGIYVEGWGGDIPVVEVSSKTGQGVDDLLDLILLVSEMENLKASSTMNGRGIIIESHLDPRRGITVTALITNGTVRVGDKIIAGQIKGRIKIMEDFLGKSITSATFSSPVRIIGFEDIPLVGSEFKCYQNESELETIINEDKFKATQIRELGAKDNNTLQIPTIIKSDVLSSSEALEYLLDQLGKEKQWVFKVLLNDIGDLSESDIKIVPSNLTLILLFRVNIKSEVKNYLMNNKNLVIIAGNIIYEIKDRLITTVESTFVNKPTEEIIGKLKVLTIFNPEKGNQLVGGQVMEGIARNKTRFHLYRNNELIGEGKVINLQRNRVDVTEVNTGLECGLLIECSKTILKDDLFEFYQKIS